MNSKLWLILALTLALPLSPVALAQGRKRKPVPLDKVYKADLKAHSKALEKARKDKRELRPLRKSWLTLLRRHQQRTQQLMKGERKDEARRLYDQLRFEELRLLFTLEQSKAGWALFETLKSERRNKLAACRLMIMELRQRQPSALPGFYQSLWDSMKAESPALTKALGACGEPGARRLLWIWDGRHPMGRFGMARAAALMKGEVYAVRLDADSGTPLEGVKPCPVPDNQREALREALAISSVPLLLVFDAKGEIALVDPNMLELGNWLRAKEAEKP